MEFPALSVMVILRQDMGYRILNPFAILAVTGLLAVACILAMPNSPDARPGDLLIFAGISFICGLGQKFRRWRQLSRHQRQHSYYTGTSPFEFRWLPAMFRRNRRIARFIDPLVCGLVGGLIFPFSHALGLWLLFSALCLRTFEYTCRQRRRKLNLDTLDGLIESEIQAETVERFEPTPGQRSPSSASGIPTGLGDDILANIKQRKK
jgi:hypothetical protein